MDAFTAARQMLVEAVHDSSPLGGENALAFAQRVFAADASLYVKKVTDLGLAGRGTVFDAGCGFGQWTVALADLNETVIATDVDAKRTSFLRELCAVAPVPNVSVKTSSLENLPIADRCVDAVFAFGVVFLSDARQALSEFARVLRPGGRLYFNFPTVWWYADIWEKHHNQAFDDDLRTVAASALQDSLAATRRGALGEPNLDPSAVSDALTGVVFSRACVCNEGSAVGDMGIAQSHAFGPRFGDDPTQLEVRAERD